MPRTTVEIDDELLKAAKRITGKKTTKGVVELALQTVINQQHKQALLKLKGSGIVSLSPEDIEELRSDE